MSSGFATGKELVADFRAMPKGTDPFMAKKQTD
jgi:hypothetical protein